MKKLILFTIFTIAISCNKVLTVKSKSAEISCGQCQFDLEGDGCSLAVKFTDLNNKTYYVEGFDIDDFGDAHDENKGFCNVIRIGEVEGKVINGKFLASKVILKD